MVLKTLFERQSIALVKHQVYKLIKINVNFIYLPAYY